MPPMSRERSPNYPNIPLEESLDSTDKLFAKIGRSAVNRETAAIALGYASLNGSANKALAALNAYGLMNRGKNGHVSLSDTAIKIIRPVSEESQKLLMKQAALKPKAFADIAEKYGELDEQILSRSLLHDGFTEEGATKAARIYKENEALVGSVQAQESPVQEEDYAPENANDGVPDSNKQIDETPKSVVNPSSKQPKVDMTSQSLVSDSQELFPIPLDVGKAFIPRGMSEDDFQFLIDALNLYRRKLVSKIQPSKEEESE